ncbi:MAG: hypothetical protein ACI86M_001630 [Saprospiraceae bacterium]|jgi:uncharacterized protein YciI
MIHILHYNFTTDYLNARKPHRINHFDHVKPYIDRRELLLGGATEAGTPAGILIFDKLSFVEIEIFAKSDPYVINNVALSYKIVKWNAVAGSLINHISEINK